MIQKVIVLMLLLLTFTSAAIAAPQSFSQMEVTWAPFEPTPGDQITVTVGTQETNISGIVMQVCVKTEDNYVCRIPQQMPEINGDFVYSFYINETAEVHLNLTVQYEDGFDVYDNSTSFKVGPVDEGNGGTPGFGFLMAVMAVGLAAGYIGKNRKRL
jgi:hypothetical protein